MNSTLIIIMIIGVALVIVLAIHFQNKSQNKVEDLSAYSGIADSFSDKEGGNTVDTHRSEKVHRKKDKTGTVPVGDGITLFNRLMQNADADMRNTLKDKQEYIETVDCQYDKEPILRHLNF